MIIFFKSIKLQMKSYRLCLMRYIIMQIIIQKNTNFNIISTFNPTWLMFMKHLNTCLHQSAAVDSVCANTETRMLNDHHLQALGLKGGLLLTSTFLQDRHQRWLRE